MPTPIEEPVRCWQASGRSVRGASHVRSASPNQDAIAWAPHSHTGAGFLLAVADGHGSARCFRSEYGSRFAVEVALLVLGTREAVTAEDRRRLAREMVTRWRQTVRVHLCEHPLSADELNGLERKLGAAARKSVELDPVLAYGSTLLAASVSETTGVYLQLGDGDILMVSEDGAVSRPWPRPEDLLGDETP